MNRDHQRAPAGLGTAFAGAATPADVNDRFQAAVAHHQRGALAEAERGYRQILALVPTHADSLHNLGLIALNGGDAKGAAALIDNAIASRDGVAEYHYNAALAQRALNRMGEAAVHLERATTLRPDYVLAHLNLGNVRREEGRPAEAAACYERAIALRPDCTPAHFNLANILAEQRRWDMAAAHYNEVLARAPEHAEAHAGLGSALTDLGQPDEAIPHLERALTLRPDLAGGYENLGKAYMAAGNVHLALLAVDRALTLNETPQAHGLFAQCAMFAEFTADDSGRFRRWVLRALAEAWAPPRELTQASISLIKLNSAVRDLIARAAAVWPVRIAAAEMLGSREIVALAADELLRCLLEYNPVTDVGLERLLVGVRAAMLERACAAADDSARDNGDENPLLGFCCTIARQCFINEYVFPATDDEIVLLQRLRQRIETSSPDEISPFAVAAFAAYAPLHTLANAETLRARDWPEPFAALMVQQIEEPAEEYRLRATIPALTDFAGEVSRVVRAQYEESPYPRWIKPGPPTQPAILDRRPEPVRDVLIAGCGTGLFTLEFARKATDARFLAIDLSLSSLSYAKRMAQNLDVTNVEFAQADIMKADAIGRSFDFIDASGVLHHLADPWAGWRALLSLLRPGGLMQIGLYSERARRNVVAVRALIATRGLKPVPDDIRRLRQMIMAEPGGSLLGSVTQWSDFFTTSECRDLLFHPQEHRITLRDIKSFLAGNGLQFAGFILDSLAFRRFAARFPAQAAMSGFERWRAFTDLDRWDAFEAEAPDTFAGMYRFWIHKPAEAG